MEADVILGRRVDLQLTQMAIIGVDKKRKWGFCGGLLTSPQNALVPA